MRAEMGSADCLLSYHTVPFLGEEAFFEGPGSRRVPSS